MNWDNKEEVKEYNKKYQEVNKARIKEKGKRYYIKNKKKITKRHKIYAQKNKEKLKRYNAKRYQRKRKDILKQIKEYRQNNKEKVKGLRRMWKARMRNIIHDFSTKEWIQKLKDTFGVCPRCNRFVGIENLELDHIHPISKAKQGQIYTIDDVQPLCGRCNKKKSNKIA